MKECLICRNDESEIRQEDYGQRNIVYCPNCGDYVINKLTMSQCDYKRREDRAKISHWIRLHQAETPVELTKEKIEYIIKNFTLPSPREQADNMLIWMGENYPKPNDTVNSELNKLVASIGAYDYEGVKYVLDFLNEQGMFVYFEAKFMTKDRVFHCVMSFRGWDRYYELQRSNKDSRLAFMAMKFGEEPLTTIYSNIMKDAVNKTGFDLRKLDEEKKAGLIDDKLRVEIRRSKFLIADLTHDNNGAYWEAGFAEGLGMPVIYVCEEEKFKTIKTHFDTNHHLTVCWRNDKEGLEKFADELKATIRATFPGEAKMGD